MKAYVLIETAAGKTKNVKKSLAKVKSPRATVAAMDAVTGPYDFIAVVDGQSLDAIGSLVTESFFGIPGLGSYTIDAIEAQDFSVVRAMVFLGSVLYIIGLILTDISYTWADPRVRLS